MTLVTAAVGGFLAGLIVGVWATRAVSDWIKKNT